jgi:hypothetical protein
MSSVLRFVIRLRLASTCVATEREVAQADRANSTHGTVIHTDSSHGLHSRPPLHISKCPVRAYVAYITTTFPGRQRAINKWSLSFPPAPLSPSPFVSLPPILVLPSSFLHLIFVVSPFLFASFVFTSFFQRYFLSFFFPSFSFVVSFLPVFLC